ncbi:hypothetical protein CHUAL_009162 [Chamberlinius hualienensis]
MPIWTQLEDVAMTSLPSSTIVDGILSSVLCWALPDEDMGQQHQSQPTSVTSPSPCPLTFNSPLFPVVPFSPPAPSVLPTTPLTPPPTSFISWTPAPPVLPTTSVTPPSASFVSWTPASQTHLSPSSSQSLSTPAQLPLDLLSLDDWDSLQPSLDAFHLLAQNLLNNEQPGHTPQQHRPDGAPARPFRP